MQTGPVPAGSLPVTPRSLGRHRQQHASGLGAPEVPLIPLGSAHGTLKGPAPGCEAQAQSPAVLAHHGHVWHLPPRTQPVAPDDPGGACPCVAARRCRPRHPPGGVRGARGGVSKWTDLFLLANNDTITGAPSDLKRASFAVSE